MGVSGAIVALAPNYLTYTLGRALFGVVVGGFWSMSAATAIRLVPSSQIPRALALINGGNALATVVAAPLGAYLGGIIGWRGAFLCLVPVALVTLVGNRAGVDRIRRLDGDRRRPAGHLGADRHRCTRWLVGLGREDLPEGRRGRWRALRRGGAVAIGVGSTVGGLLFDHSGYQSTFVASAALLLVSAGLTFKVSRATSFMRV